jgi:hypothetical protein
MWWHMDKGEFDAFVNDDKSERGTFMENGDLRYHAFSRLCFRQGFDCSDKEFRVFQNHFNSLCPKHQEGIFSYISPSPLGML